MAQGLINNGVSVTKNYTDNELELLKSVEVTSALQTLVFNNLDTLKNDTLILKGTLVNPNTNEWVQVYINDVNSASSYFFQYIMADNSSVSVANGNNGLSIYGEATSSTEFEIEINVSYSDYFVTQTKQSRNIGSSAIKMIDVVNSSTFLAYCLNKLTLVADFSNGIGVGSKFKLYRVKGQVQQTWDIT